MSVEVSRKVKFKKLLIEPVRNGIYKQKEFHGRGCKIINMGELFSFPRLHDVPMKRVELTEKEQSKSLVQQGDLLFARRSLVAEGAGRCSIVSEVNEPTTFESSIIRARPNPALVSSDYLYYFFSSRLGRELMGTILRQMAVSGITGSDLMELEIECPTLEQQKSLAAFLSALDDRITQLRETNATLEAIAQALFKSWFVDFDPVRAKAEGRQPQGMDAATAALFPDSFEASELGLVPKGWPRLAFTETVKIIGGGTPKTSVPEYWEGHIPWFSVVDAPVITDIFVIDTVKHISSAGLNGSSTKLLREGTTIISARGTVGRLALVGKEMAMNQSCYGIQGKADDAYFTYFSTYRLVESLKQRSHGSVFDTITTETMRGVTVIYPDMSVIEAFEVVLSPLMLRVKENLQQAQTLTQLRDTLLPRLISGQLRLPEAQAQLEA
jgi:restriction endonuclease S subunit